MLMVIGVHVTNNYMPVKMQLTGWAERARFVLVALLLICNPLFIMISGRFNLTFRTSSGSDSEFAGRSVDQRPISRQNNEHQNNEHIGAGAQGIRASLRPYARYYYKRFISLILPYLLYAGGLGFVAYLLMNHRTFGGAVSGALFDLFSGYDDSVYWFVFMLAGFVLATPFLAPMMHAVGRTGAWLLIGLSIGVAAIEQICNLAGYRLLFVQSFPWHGLIVYYLLGFALEMYPPSVCVRRCLYVIAPFALVWTAATPALFPGQPAQTMRTLTAAYAAVVTAVFLLFRYDVHIRSRRVSTVITWLAGYSYTIYLVHSPLTKALIGPRLPDPVNGWQYMGLAALMFVIALSASLVLALTADNLVLKPLQRLLRKAL
ncbi:acyltransferase family protein [Bifidobacterium scaligerum]|uniref:Acyltransferase n=1 Tax=Bifidobacterium scaligerum TaxID=2052656 RepID=A0A2M9HPE6_9BIFI|nr:acyltransferase [Bifidobacterium scaligerum]